MTKREKRLQKMRKSPRNITFDDLIRVLEDYGFVIRSGKGSHYSARVEINARVWTIAIVRPHGGKKYVYVGKVKETLEYLDEIEQWKGSRNE